MNRTDNNRIQKKMVMDNSRKVGEGASTNRMEGRYRAVDVGTKLAGERLQGQSNIEETFGRRKTALRSLNC